MAGEKLAMGDYYVHVEGLCFIGFGLGYFFPDPRYSRQSLSVIPRFVTNSVVLLHHASVPFA